MVDGHADCGQGAEVKWDPGNARESGTWGASILTDSGPTRLPVLREHEIGQLDVAVPRVDEPGESVEDLRQRYHAGTQPHHRSRGTDVSTQKGETNGTLNHKSARRGGGV